MLRDTVVCHACGEPQKESQRQVMGADASCGLREHGVLCPSYLSSASIPHLEKSVLARTGERFAQTRLSLKAKYIHTAVALRLCSPITATYSDQTSAMGRAVCGEWGHGSSGQEGVSEALQPNSPVNG